MLLHTPEGVPTGSKAGPTTRRVHAPRPRGREQRLPARSMSGTRSSLTPSPDVRLGLPAYRSSSVSGSRPKGRIGTVKSSTAVNAFTKLSRSRSFHPSPPGRNLLQQADEAGRGRGARDPAPLTAGA